MHVLDELGPLERCEDAVEQAVAEESRQDDVVALVEATPKRVEVLVRGDDLDRTAVSTLDPYRRRDPSRPIPH